MVFPIPPMTPFNNMVAGGINIEGSIQPFELFAGDLHVETDRATAGGTDIPQFTPVVVAPATNIMTAWDGTATNGYPNAVTAQPVPAGTIGPIYSQAYFNMDALLWPASVTTVAAKKGAFFNSKVRCGPLI